MDVNFSIPGDDASRGFGYDRKICKRKRGEKMKDE